MKKAYFTVRAFTLVELIVVIAIIAILTGIILTSLTGSKAKGRDAQRVSDIGQIQLALELYFDRCHSYPLPDTSHTLGSGSYVDSSMLTQACPNVSGVTFGLYTSQIATPPAGANQPAYDYYVNSSSNPTDYILHATLEGVSSASANSLVNNVPSYGQSFTCDATTNYCVGPK
jgi:prepilin-type N-terminal cleavage/methylation domain-containing protein